MIGSTENGSLRHRSEESLNSKYYFLQHFTSDSPYPRQWYGNIHIQYGADTCSGNIRS